MDIPFLARGFLNAVGILSFFVHEKEARLLDSIITFLMVFGNQAKADHSNKFS